MADPVASSGLPPELWTLVQSAPASFTPQYFLEVSRNLLENPNITASHLSRAELSYKNIIKHLKPDHQPQLVPGGVPGYSLEWTVVRKLIPRNPKLDEPLVQTCHLFVSTDDVTVQSQDGGSSKRKAERYLVIYIPHASDPESIPFYHPKVKRLAFLYTYVLDPPADNEPGQLSIFYDLFPGRPLDNRMTRTALKMLEVIHKHSRGRQAGYKKRVHHDVVIAQKLFQDTYTYLKGNQTQEEVETIAAKVEEDRRAKAKQMFPGFVDIGCGNGLLVWILNEEGWPGWGFDARKRSTWATFGERYEDKLKEMLLVPEALKVGDGEEEDIDLGTPSHNGIFPPRTFIVSNHADELTIWTPCLAFLSESPFIAIPCCSHNFGGTRFRAPPHRKYITEPGQGHIAEGGAIKQPSAYASLCSYVSHLTASMSYVPEKEHLRIPSTRNIAILGRQKAKPGELMGNLDDKMEFVRGIIEKEMPDTGIEQVRLQWLKRGSGLMKPGKGGH
ncbi:DUF1613-domain-containing protein [Corynespora cassiicola Philippines]|uniref:tRNA (uracil-O(2)-)-methyltransferase n=1 Tax=Corynespora cassiicola Philippines TaxID=1448308 RepID=A0A2T2NUR9_CORCC|nr:DUF1613-domain-containing protein [Corynespora cassiicola Philippines]